jgi:superfamily II DNA or RNA helicase
MILDEKKLNRQKLCFTRWLENLKISIVKAGIIQAVTGFGKTFIAIMTILDMNTRHPDRTTIVVVPTTKLKDDWTRNKQVFNDDGELIEDFGHILKHNLQNVQVFVVNTYTKYAEWECDLLILDEAHHYAGIDAKFFSTVIKITKYRFGMGLSATIDAKQKMFFEQEGWTIVDTIDEIEAEREGYTSTSITYNLGIPLSGKDKEFNEKINEEFKFYFKKFEHKFELVRACNIGDKAYMSVRDGDINLGSKSGKEWREWWAKKNGWDGHASHPYSPDNLSKYAAQAMFKMRKRKTVWQNSPTKLIFIKQLVEKFSRLKTITFCETSDFADQIAELFPKKALAYHTNLVTLAIKGDEVIRNPSKEDQKVLKKKGFVVKGKTVLKREAIEKFQDPHGTVTLLSTVRALDEGFDVKKIEFVLMVAYNSTRRQDTQRSGRGKRVDYENLGKKTLIVNLYMKGTQEEKWLRAKQVGKRLVRWVDSVDEISINQTISLGYGPRPETLEDKVHTTET